MRLLVVEDDPDLNRQLVAALSDAGYAVDTAFDGEEGHFLGDTEPYDAVVLDLGLPKKDGLSVLEHWRRDEPQDAGADPHRARALERQGRRHGRRRRRLRGQAVPYGGSAGAHARAAAPLGRTCHATRSSAVRSASTPRPARVTVDGQAVKLTSHEYRVLAYLMLHRGRVVSRTELVEHLYEQDFDRDSNTVEVFIGRLRKKLPVDLIKTVRGLGYRLVGRER